MEEKEVENGSIRCVGCLYWDWNRYHLIQQESITDNPPELSSLQKFLCSPVTAVVSGMVFFFGAIFVLMEIGLARYDNYEYYGRYPVLFVVPGLVGLFLPAVLAWIIRKSRDGHSD